MMRWTLLRRLACGVFLVALSGCGDAPAGAVPPTATAQPTPTVALTTPVPTSTAQPATLVNATATVDLYKRNPVPDVWLNPPLFPGAQQVKTTRLDEPGELLPVNEGYLYHRQSITFTVSETAASVVAFYRRALIWPPSNWGRTVPNAAVESFDWSDGAQMAPSIYFIDVITSAASAGGTSVEISSDMFPGY